MSPPDGTTGKRRAVSTKVLPKPVGDGEEPSALWFLAPLLMRAGPTGPDKTWLLGCKLPASQREFKAGVRSHRSRSNRAPICLKTRVARYDSSQPDAGHAVQRDYNTGHCG